MIEVHRTAAFLAVTTTEGVLFTIHQDGLYFIDYADMGPSGNLSGVY